MTAVAKWWSNLDATWRGVTIIVAVATVSFSVAMTASAYVGLPEQVRQNTERLQEVERNQEQIMGHMIFSNCMAVAAAKGDPWESCQADPLQYLRLNK